VRFGKSGCRTGSCPANHGNVVSDTLCHCCHRVPALHGWWPASSRLWAWLGLKACRTLTVTCQWSPGPGAAMHQSETHSFVAVWAALMFREHAQHAGSPDSVLPWQPLILIVDDALHDGRQMG
jgi:hypothetical protein